MNIVVHYETIKRELKMKPISKCRWDGRLKTKTEESTRLSDTGLLGELENLKIKTRLIDEKFVGVMGDLEVMDAQSILIIIRKDTVLVRVRPTLDLSWTEKVVWWKWKSERSYCPN
jgi:hypothetical protein